MKRREFLIASAGFSGSLLSKGLLADGKPCPPPNVGVQGGTREWAACAPEAIADWAARSAAPGVLWSHNFAEADEVSRYRWKGGVGNSPTDQDGTCIFMPNGGDVQGGAVRIVRPIGGATSSSWIRPFSPMQAWNNVPADPGLAAFPSTPAYSPTQGVDTGTYWTHGFYAPASVQAAKPAITYHGDELWLSFKVRISGSRATATGQPQKLWYITDITGSVNQFNLIFDTDDTGAWVNYTGATSRYPDGSSGRLRSPQFGPETSTPVQTESPYQGCTYPYFYNDPRRCWLFPFDRWVTFLFHVKTGVTSMAGAPETQWKGPSDGVLEVAVWQPGRSDWQYLFRDSQWSYLWGYQNRDPEGYGSFIATSYVQAALANSYYTEFCQMIFSQRPIACPIA